VAQFYIDTATVPLTDFTQQFGNGTLTRVGGRIRLTKTDNDREAWKYTPAGEPQVAEVILGIRTVSFNGGILGNTTIGASVLISGSDALESAQVGAAAESGVLISLGWKGGVTDFEDTGALNTGYIPTNDSFFSTNSFTSGTAATRYWTGAASDFPASPTASYTSSGLPTAAGGVGFGGFRGGVYDIFFLSIGTDGDSAPTSPIVPTLGSITTSGITSNSVNFSLPVTF